MTVLEMMDILELLEPEAELFVDVIDTVRSIVRVEDDSQGVYIVVDQMANDRETW